MKMDDKKKFNHVLVIDWKTVTVTMFKKLQLVGLNRVSFWTNGGHSIADRFVLNAKDANALLGRMERKEITYISLDPIESELLMECPIF